MKHFIQIERIIIIYYIEIYELVFCKSFQGSKFNKLKVHFKSPTVQDLKRLHRQSYAQWMFHKEPESHVNLESEPSFVRANSKRFLKSVSEKNISGK